ncbi:helix-turn-helix domain-containing protein [Nocardiopsis alba]|uniref:helix-turn-helix domain-containing protein n=1 Tax=Nocardiopsis alba TaxID=53437 RepID=UPI00364CEFC3
MSDNRGPVVHQALLIQHLVALRIERGLTQEQVGKALDWSEAKVMRFEGGSQVLPLRMLDSLLSLYQVSNKPLGRKLRSLGEAAHESAWWKPYRKLMHPDHRRFVGYEAGADRILQVQTGVIPGLLQTREYAHWIISAWEEPELVEPLLDIRMRRQGTLVARTPRPQQVYLLDETVFHKPMGQPDDGLMSRQLHHLLSLAQMPELEIRILPFGHGSHFEVKSGSFILLEFENGLSPILYREQVNKCTLTSSKSDIESYREIFEKVVKSGSMSPSESLATIEKYARMS